MQRKTAMPVLKCLRLNRVSISVCPVVSVIDGVLMNFVDTIGAVGFAADHVQTELSIVVVGGNGLITMGHGVNGTGHILAAGDQNNRSGIPGEGTAAGGLQLGGIAGGGGFNIGVIAAAHALDFDGLAGTDIVNVSVVALFEHILSTAEPVHLDDLGFVVGNGFGAGCRVRGDFAFGYAAGLHIAGNAGAGILHPVEITAFSNDIHFGVYIQRFLRGSGGCALIDVGLLGNIAGIAGGAVQTGEITIAGNALVLHPGPIAGNAGEAQLQPLLHGKTLAGSGRRSIHLGIGVDLHGNALCQGGRKAGHGHHDD